MRKFFKKLQVKFLPSQGRRGGVSINSKNKELQNTPSSSPCQGEKVQDFAGFLQQFRTLFVFGRFKSGLKIQNTGFSLIELLVAITIGGVVLTTVMTSYVAMTKTNLRLDMARQLQKETNFAVIRMADKIRNFPIQSCQEKKIVLENEKGEFEYLINQGRLRLDGQDLFSSNIKVVEVKFTCFGVENANSARNLNDIQTTFVSTQTQRENPAKLQPRVQIYLKVSHSRKNKNGEWIENADDITNWVQTTISSRVY